MYQDVCSALAFGISAYTDLKERRVRKKVIAGYLLAAAAGHFIMRDMEIADLLMGAIPGGICLLLSLVSRQGLGLGDSLLILGCGISLGMAECVSVAVFAFFWAGIWAMVQLVFFRVRGKKEFAFVPFLMAGWIVHRAVGG